jgi:hypothetical protein
MTSFFSDLEDQLRNAAHERASATRAPGEPAPRARGRWGWLAGGARLIPVAAAVAVTLAVVGGALVLLGHRDHAPASPAGQTQTNGQELAQIVRTTPMSQLRREFALISLATRKVVVSPACHVTVDAPVKLIHATPGTGLLSTLGLLRRPATAADRLPAHALGATGPGVSVYAGAARRALAGARSATFIVPVRESRIARIPSSECFALQNAALRKALPSMPRTLRAPTATLAAASMAYARSLAGQGPFDAICEVAVMSHESLSSSCGMTAAQIRSGMVPDQDNGTFSGLVPDGVSSVTLRFAAAGGRPARSVTVQVHDNAYTAHVTGLPARPVFPAVTWHAADGRVLKTYSEPSKANPQLLRQICIQHPEACAPMVLASSATAVQTGSLASAGPAVKVRPAAAAKTVRPARAPKTGG